jgi:hypothetical protein
MEKGRGSRRSRAVGELRQAHCDKSAAKRSKTRRGRLREQCWRRVCGAFGRGGSSRRQEAVPTAAGPGGRGREPSRRMDQRQVSGLGVVDIARERQRRALCDLYTTMDGCGSLMRRLRNRGVGAVALQEKQSRVEQSRASESENRRGRDEGVFDERGDAETDRQEEEEATSRRGSGSGGRGRERERDESAARRLRNSNSG